MRHVTSLYELTTLSIEALTDLIGAGNAKQVPTSLNPNCCYTLT